MIGKRPVATALSSSKQINADELLCDDAVEHLGDVRKAIKGLDLRVPNLRAALPDLVLAYQKAREIVDAGHGPKGGDAAKG